MEMVMFGDTACPCIGFDHIKGETTVTWDDKEVVYPADLGARCEAWDDGVHPDCVEEGEDEEEDKMDIISLGNKSGKKKDAHRKRRCKEQWCYVDACFCHLPVLPQPSELLPDARYRGRSIFYSYATCGGKDTWADVVSEAGSVGCRCIGFAEVPGTMQVTIKGQWSEEGAVVDFPAEMGGKCQDWDNGVHPACQGKNRPDWCYKQWCYVDPCSCKLEQPPKVTMYLPEATFTGKSLYYSYETCGANDTYTKKHNPEACVNQNNTKDCLSLIVRGGQKCAWTRGRCLGAELVSHPLCTHLLPHTDKVYLKSLAAERLQAPQRCVAGAALLWLLAATLQRT